MFQLQLLASYLVTILLSLNGIVVGFSVNSPIVLAETATPLAIPQDDPLLPPSNLDRQLSPFEIKRIRREIDALEIKANNQLEQDKAKEAFQLWFRQLRLYRAINLTAEIEALGRVGEIAWQNNRGEELKVITRRLELIYRDLEVRDRFTADLLIILGTSFEGVRHLDNAIAIYNTLYQQSLRSDNSQLEEKYLEILGELYLSKFNYTQAAITYEKLLNRNEINLKQKDTPQNGKTISYLQQLIKIYNYTQQREEATEVKQKLIDYYLLLDRLEPIANLKISLGDDYQFLEETKLALNCYQEAITFGQSLQQIAFVSNALQKIGDLYERQKQYSLAIETYETLLDIEKQAYNSYGVMNGYDRLGKIYWLQQEYKTALTAFEAGLNVARSLNYRVSYFTDLIERVKAEIQ